ncbi:hypothetical protein [Citrobacter portucalensis]|uniref:hypothetical protein n=1 Tax=Citrobacter portucalensis TaxID=1639133 RepID=UPI001F2432E1|nr:hypothetical protein [Citrobacter portucalensis]MCE9759218.1 hypothetical protein [Citrobacter portucalensis]
MKPDVNKIIADIKATKGNRKFCNGLAGTLQDDNYASSICKYVKTVTPERIDLLIEYAEKLEAEVTDMAVQLANAESKCGELAAENAALNKFITQSCYVFDGEQHEISDAYICATDGGMPETPATDALLAEVRAQGVELFAASLKVVGGHEHPYSAVAKEFAAQLRKGAAS